MKKRLVSIFLCLFLISLQLLTTVDIALAEGELTVTTETGGNVTKINGQTYVSGLDFYFINYKIKNTSNNELIINQIVEKGPGNKEYTHEIGKNLKPDDEPLTQTGGQFLGNMEFIPNTVEYTVKYTILSDDGDRTKDKVVEVKGPLVYVYVAEVDFDVDYTADTAGPVFKGHQVTLKAEVLSISNVPLYNLIILDKELGLEIGTVDVLNPGKKASVQTSIQIDKATTGELLIIYDDPIGLIDQPLEKSVNTGLVIQVKDEAPVSSLNLSGKTSMNKIPGETSVDFELTIKNTGNTALTELKCMDWNGKEFHTHNALLPDEEITVSYTGNLEPDKKYELLVQARVENSNQLIKSAWSTSLEKLAPKVEIQRSLSTEKIAAGEPFVLEYVLRNTGNVDLNDIKISETHFGEITHIEVLKAGQEMEFNKELKLNEKASSRTILTAIDTETKKEYSYESSEMEFVLDDTDESSRQSLSVILQTEEDELSKPGTVKMECIIENTGKEPLYNLVFTLMDRDMIIDNISVFEPGDKKAIFVPALRVEETETFTVEVNGLGADQQKFTTKSQPLTITLSESGLSGQFSVIRVVLIVIILLCILVIGVLIYTLKGSPRFPFGKKKKVNRQTR
ncbi:MAG: hypothetical protein PHG58_04995 [Clostridia bacterium]|nr:hypothetical protein [Clostridia bacterium]